VVDTLGDGQTGRAKKRGGPIDRALAAFNPRLPRIGRIRRLVSRALIGHDRPMTTGELRSYAYYDRPRANWQYHEVKCALRRLGAQICGRSSRGGFIWKLNATSKST
jgi:hypothetical protein